MKKVFYKPKTWLILMMSVAALMTMCSCANQKTGVQKQRDALSTVQCENLYTLGKVWGVAKYYHPAFTTGAADWDKELLNLLPKVMEAKDSTEVDALLVDWLKGLDNIEPKEPSPPYIGDKGTKQTKAEPNLDGLLDGAVSSDLSAAILSLTKSPVSIGTGGPMIFTSYGASSFENEKPYEEMNYDDDAMRFLGLYRYWNVIEFYYPYKDIIDDDWDAVLVEFIPRIVEGDELTYKLTLAEMTTRIHDSHTGILDNGGVLDLSWGTKYAPLRFSNVEDKVVVTQLTAKYADKTPLQIGDVVLKRDGAKIEAMIQEQLKYHSVSRENVFSVALQRYLFATSEDSMKLTVLRNGETLELDVPCYKDGRPEEKTMPSHELLVGNIGRINPGYLKEGELSSIMETFKDTQGLIVDLRQYPSGDLYEPLSEYIMPHSVTFANLSQPDQQFPGRFYMTEPSPYICGRENRDYYKSKIVILVNEQTISHAEFSTMALRQAPNATVIGSPSIGADGNVAKITLPGNVLTRFTSKGVYTPDGGQTQRIGLQPDVVCKPTIAGITEGRDELLETAIQYISSASTT